MEKLKAKIKSYQAAVKSFEKLLKVDLSSPHYSLNAVLIDGIKNGQIQKFEYCTKMTWKIIKRFLYEIDGVDAKSPKESLKEFYLKGHTDEKNYQLLIRMLDDRNALSHLYNEKEFEAIHQTLPRYCQGMNEVLEKIQESL